MTKVHGQGLEFGVNADHISIAKFQSSSDPTYLKIKDVVLKMATEIYEQCQLTGFTGVEDYLFLTNII